MTVTVRKRRALRRLIYKTLPQVAGQASKLPQLVLKFEVELLDLLSASTEATQDLQKFPTHEDMLLSDESDSSADHASSQGVSQSGTLPEALKNGWDTSCQAGRETLVNVMFPDRSVCQPWIVEFLTSCLPGLWICNSVFLIGMVLL